MRKTEQSWGENYSTLLESVRYRRRAGEIISECAGTELHMYRMSYNFFFPFLIPRNKQRTKLHKINRNQKHLSIFSSQITRFSNMWAKIQPRLIPLKVYVKWDMTEDMLHLFNKGLHKCISASNGFPLCWNWTHPLFSFSQNMALKSSVILTKLQHWKMSSAHCVCTCVHTCTCAMCTHTHTYIYFPLPQWCLSQT